MMAILTNVRLYLIVALICISLIISNTEASFHMHVGHLMQIILLTFICPSFWTLLHGRVSKLPNLNEEVFMENEEPKEIIC